MDTGIQKPKRKRGKRGNKPTKSMRMAAAALAAGTPADPEAATTSEPVTRQAEATEDDAPVTRQSDSDPETVLQGEEDIVPSIREEIVPSVEEEPGASAPVTRQPSPMSGSEDEFGSGVPSDFVPEAQSPSPVQQQLGPVQPTGEYCVVISRLSSGKAEPDPTNLKSRKERVVDYIARRISEGDVLADRLAANCPKPVTFTEVFSHCGIRHSGDVTDWFKTQGKKCEFMANLREWFHRPHIRNMNRTVTVLIRGVDGITTNPWSFCSFLKMMVDCGVTAQLIFQWNKICPEIAPSTLFNFRGLGGIAEFSAQDFQDHLENKSFFPEIQRIVDIWEFLTENKAASEGALQDRNTLLDADTAGPELVSKATGSAGRKKAR